MYIEIFRALQKEEVRYLVVGGLAMNLQGIPRMTAVKILRRKLGGGG